MCGRFTLTPRDFAEIAGLLDAVADPALAASYRPRYNLPPTDPHMIVKKDGDKRLVAARWAFGRKKPLINARAETLATNGLFKQAFKERRCLVPADGFFEWAGAGGRKQPIWFHAPPGQIFTFAGLYDENGFTIITTTPNALVAPTHDRMPAILVGAAADAWLERPDASLLGPAPDGLLTATPVSRRVNTVANDDEACLGPAEEPDPQAQLRLV
jgi:putative SOS response-associated peptidase YedK